MKLNKRGKVLVGIIAGLLIGMPQLSAKEFNPEKIYKKNKVESSITGKVMVPEGFLENKGKEGITVLDMKEAETLEGQNPLDYEASCNLFGDDVVFVSEGWLSNVEVGNNSYDFVGLTEKQDKIYLSFKDYNDKELNHIYLDDSEIIIIPEEEMSREKLFECVGSLVGKVEKLNK